MQSVAVKLVCDREREIDAFDPEEYWTIIAQLALHDTPESIFSAKLIERDGGKLKLVNEAEARSAEHDLREAAYRVAAVKKSQQQRNSQPPLITSTLQQEAFRSYGFSAKRTMALAQQLYEGLELGNEGHVGLITYMRTDSTRVSEEAQEQAVQYITEQYGKEYLPATKREVKAVKGAQEAHEAIRPTDPFRTPDKLSHLLNADQHKLYRLIWRRFVASQMTAAIFDVMVIDVAAGHYLLRAQGQRLKFPGYLILSPEREEASFLPQVTENASLDLLNLETEQHFTQPPARYTEATLVKALESRGIGRPSIMRRPSAPFSTVVTSFSKRKNFIRPGWGWW